MHKYEIYLQVIRGEVTIAEAAAAAQVDRSTVVRIRRAAKDGALSAGRGKRRLGIGGRVPRRVDAATKTALLELLHRAVERGWSVSAAAAVLDLGRVRAHRWMRRADLGELVDRRPGGAPVHVLLPGEEAETLAVFEQWAEVDRSHRKLAHRGSYLHRFWASSSTVPR